MAELPERETVSLPAAAEAALLRGKKLEAIKMVREEQGFGLKEAKDLVEQLSSRVSNTSRKRSRRGPTRISALAYGSDCHRRTGLLLCGR
jgi:hypothetical protein